MKICVAQTRPVKGNIEKNIVQHTRLIKLAASHAADMIIFPELSLTGYEPALAKSLATDKDDKIFEEFQHLSNSKNMLIGAGMPTNNNDGINISMIIFQPGKPREIYSKKYLHQDETPFFVSGKNLAPITINMTNIAIAICYELSVPAHSENATQSGSDIYIASVAKSPAGVAKAIETLSAIAEKYAMTVLLSNCIGHCDDFDCGGRSAVWNNRGQLQEQLDDRSEGILMIDNTTQETSAFVLPDNL